jgi:hypothetical protein
MLLLIKGWIVNLFVYQQTIIYFAQKENPSRGGWGCLNYKLRMLTKQKKSISVFHYRIFDTIPYS